MVFSGGAVAGRAGLRGRLWVMLAVAPFVLGVLSGNVFALHAGMASLRPSLSVPTATASEASAPLVVVGTPSRAQDPQATAATTGGTLTVAQVAKQAPAGRGTHPPTAQLPASPRGWHLLHLVGACMAVLMAAVALLGGLVQARRTVYDLLLRRLPLAWPCSAARRFAWRPPPLWPPTSSPVVRQ